jgi:gamma-glutamyltranspeptidase/glutathione hydrolase
MRAVLLALGLLLGGCATAAPVETQPRLQHGLVAAANPLAAEAGMAVLRRGGTAADAAVAVQATLGLVEPQSSGLGGGSFLTWYDAATHKVETFDGREAAPRGATPDMFLDAGGKPIPFGDAVVSGRATGVPGAVAMLGLAQSKHGKLAWPSLFEGPVKLAEGGFAVTPRLQRMIDGQFPQNTRPDVIAYFSKPDGSKLRTGDVLKNPAYASTLRRIAAEGREGLLAGPIAQAIVAKTHEGPLGGTLTLADLAAYRAVQSDALCRPYRVYIVCVPNPPSSGVGVLQALAILEHTDIDKRGPADPKAWLQFVEASRLMYADRDRYVGDPAFVDVPVKGLLDPAYVATRAALIGDRAGPAPEPGTPPGAGVRAPDRTKEPAGTTHFVIVDRFGNAASMTTTVESIFGTGRMVDGFFLNNQLTDFSFSPVEKDGVAAANAVAPGKRPRSSMSPVIVLDRQGRFVAALGSPGGNAILAYNLKVLVGVLDWKLTMQQAIDLPNVIARGGFVAGEPSKFAAETLAGLKALGVEVKPGMGEDSGLHGVMIRAGRFDGGADPRREGVVLAE